MSRRRLRPAAPLLAIAALFVFLRLPSVFEPAWSADEGAYADIGRALDHGAVLYAQVWDNKPPGIYYLAAAVSLGGASPLRMQLLAMSAVFIGAVVVFLIGRRLSDSRPVALLGATLYIILASLPDLSGDQLNTELIAAPVAAAGVALVLTTRSRRTRSSLFAGVLLVFAFLIDIRCMFDLLAALTIGTVIAIPNSAASGAALRVQAAARAGAPVMGGFLLIGAAAAVALQLGGSFGGLVSVLLHSDTGYVGYFQSQAAFAAGTPTPAGTAALLIAVARLLVTLGAGLLLAWVLWRRGHHGIALVTMWLTLDVIAASLDARGFTHYLQLAAVSLSLTAAMAVAMLWQHGGRWMRAAAVVVLVAVWPFAAVVLYLPPLVGAVATGDSPPSFPNLALSSMTQYYTLGWGRIAGTTPSATWNRHFVNDLYPADENIAAILDAHSGSADHVFIWGGASPWAYALADRLPSSQYVWMGSAYAITPGAENTALSQIAATPPRVLVVGAPLPQPLLTFLETHGYRSNVSPGGIGYWSADPSLP
ncbi:MAG: hypothetical protein JOY68_01315 [Candidatus Dormibacteraeota bacterium]|nr:hypothetical protein [Candidatus Dormibacteraeota bacterium]